jgi:hypothetical protein
MSCLSTGYSVACSTSCSGGLYKFWLASVEDIQSLTFVSGELTVITMVGATKFYEFTPYQETGSWVEAGERTNCNTVVTQTLTGVFPCHSQDVKDVIDALKACCCGFVVIHEENNGSKWIWGAPNDLTNGGVQFPAQLTAFETTTGTAINDQNQASITLVSRGTTLALPVDPALVIPV